MTLWEMATNFVAKKRAPTVYLSLAGKARDAVLDIDPSELNAEDGMSKIYQKLDGLFAIDKDQAIQLCWMPTKILRNS